MNSARARLFSHGLALIAGAGIMWVMLGGKLAELGRLRAEYAVLNGQTQRLAALEAEYGRLQKRTEGLAARLPDELELARLRAKAAEFKRTSEENARLREQLARTNAPSAAPPASPTVDEPRQPLTAEGVVPVKPGETVITGGWVIRPGQRGYAFVTPQLLADGSVQIDARLVSAPDALATAAGLGQVMVAGKEAGPFHLADARTLGGILEVMNDEAGASTFAAPRLQTLPGREGQIYVGQNDRGVRMTFEARGRTNGPGLDLSMKAVIDLPLIDFDAAR